jgi:hypothetical protein
MFIDTWILTLFHVRPDFFALLVFDAFPQRNLLALGVQVIGSTIDVANSLDHVPFECGNNCLVCPKL